MATRFEQICCKAEKKLDAKCASAQKQKKHSMAQNLIRVAISTTVIVLTFTAAYLTYLWAAAKVSS
jgi:hypothetical protein